MTYSLSFCIYYIRNFIGFYSTDYKAFLEVLVPCLGLGPKIGLGTMPFGALIL